MTNAYHNILNTQIQPWNQWQIWKLTSYGMMLNLLIKWDKRLLLSQKAAEMGKKKKKSETSTWRIIEKEIL